MMKTLCILTVLVMIVPEDALASSLPEKRVKLIKKGVYPEHSAGTYPERKNEVKDEVGVAPSLKSKKPDSMDGWLTKPKTKRITKPEAKEENSTKQGYCGHESAFGIQCAAPMNQCQEDSACPGETKCCNVEDCGLLCVKAEANPQLESDVPQFRSTPSKKSKKDVSPKETATTAEGLKLKDIMEIP